MFRTVCIAVIACALAACSAPDRPASAPDEIVGSPPPKPSSDEESYVVIEQATGSAAPRETEPTSGHIPSMSRRRITLDVRDADIHNVLRLLAEEGGVNIVVDESVRGRVTIRLVDVSVEDAFLAVLDSQGLGWTSQGSVTLIEPAP